MATELLDAPTQSETRVANYSITDAEIAAIRERATGLKPDTPKSYELVRSTIAECRSLRVAVEKRRKDLKADALEWGRVVDSEAKRITVALEEIEKPLQSAKDAVDAERERVRREKEEAIRRQIEEAAAAKRAAEEARLKAERDAEEARLAEERKALEAERAKLEAEREKIEAERAAAEKERLRIESEAHAARRKAQAEEDARQAKVRAEQQAREQAERDRLAEERRALEAERAKLAAEEAARQATIRAEQEAKERAERERIEAERRATEEAELKARREALRPDVEKLHTWAGVIRGLPAPNLKDAGAKEIAKLVQSDLETIAQKIEAWQAA